MCDLPFLALSLLVYQSFFNLGKLGYVLHDERRNFERRWKAETLKTKEQKEVLRLWEYFEKHLIDKCIIGTWVRPCVIILAIGKACSVCAKWIVGNELM